MKARELWDSIRKGSTLAIISGKQRTFLIDLTKAEKIFDTFNTSVKFTDGLIVKIRNAQTKVGAYGGGLVNKSIHDKFKAEQFYSVKFTDTGLTAARKRDRHRTL